MEREGYIESEPTPKFWIGSDIEVNKDTIIEPHGAVRSSLTIKPEDVPLDGRFLHWLPLSMRSTLAQLGLEASIDWMRFDDQGSWQELQKNGEMELSVLLVNNGHRPIEIKSGDSLFRFFHYGDSSILESAELARYIVDHEVIKGDYGSDWWLTNRKDQQVTLEDPGDATAIALAFNPDKRLWVPPADKPLHLQRRADLEQYLQPMPATEATDFFISETTARVQMDNLPGLLIAGVEEETHQRQIMSPLIDPQFGRQTSGLPIRVEISDPAQLAKNRPHVYLQLFK